MLLSLPISGPQSLWEYSDTKHSLCHVRNDLDATGASKSITGTLSQKSQTKVTCSNHSSLTQVRMHIKKQGKGDTLTYTGHGVGPHYLNLRLYNISMSSLSATATFPVDDKVVSQSWSLRREAQLDRGACQWHATWFIRDTGVSPSGFVCSSPPLLRSSYGLYLHFLGRGHVGPEWMSPVYNLMNIECLRLFSVLWILGASLFFPFLSVPCTHTRLIQV